jgi:integrase
MPALTKRMIDAAGPREREYFIWCSRSPGFGVRIYPSGKKIFVSQVRVGRATRRVKIGRYGPYTAESARSRAEEIFRVASEGRDPQAEKQQAKKAMTVLELCDEYIRAARAGLVLTRFGREKSASTITFDQGRINRHIKPILGRITAQQLTQRDAQRLVDDIAVGKTAGVFKGKPRGKAVVTGGAGTAARIVGLLGGIYTWARRRGYVTCPNPAHGIEKAGTKAKDRVLTPEELGRLGQALKEAEIKYSGAAIAVRLIALTGLRRSEACGLQWAEVDDESNTLRLGATKTGRSARVVSRRALEVLRGASRASAAFVFPDRSGAGSAHLKKQIASIFDKAGLADARSHDLRRTFATVAANEGYSDATIGELLGHSRRGVTSRHYIRRPDAALVAAADRVASRIAAFMGDVGQEAEVIDIRELRARPQAW